MASSCEILCQLGFSLYTASDRVLRVSTLNMKFIKEYKALVRVIFFLPKTRNASRFNEREEREGDRHEDVAYGGAFEKSASSAATLSLASATVC